MTDDASKELPTVIEVAAEIYAAAHNSAQIVRVTDDELREVSRREKLREGFKQAVWSRLTELGAEVKQAGAITRISIPGDTISLRQAREESAGAQETGVREIHGGMDTCVIPKKN